MRNSNWRLLFFTKRRQRGDTANDETYYIICERKIRPDFGPQGFLKSRTTNIFSAWLIVRWIARPINRLTDYPRPALIVNLKPRGYFSSAVRWTAVLPVHYSCSWMVIFSARQTTSTSPRQTIFIGKCIKILVFVLQQILIVIFVNTFINKTFMLFIFFGQNLSKCCFFRSKKHCPNHHLRHSSITYIVAIYNTEQPQVEN